MNWNPWKLTLQPWGLEGEEKAIFEATSRHVESTAFTSMLIAFVVLSLVLDACLPFDRDTGAMIGAVAFFPCFFGMRWLAEAIGEKAGERAVIERRHSTWGRM